MKMIWDDFSPGVIQTKSPPEHRSEVTTHTTVSFFCSHLKNTPKTNAHLQISKLISLISSPWVEWLICEHRACWFQNKRKTFIDLLWILKWTNRLYCLSFILCVKTSHSVISPYITSQISPQRKFFHRTLNGVDNCVLIIRFQTKERIMAFTFGWCFSSKAM